MQLPLRVWNYALPRRAFAPGKSGFASRRLDEFGIARVVNEGDRRDSHHQPPDPKSGALLIELQG